MDEDKFIQYLKRNGRPTRTRQGYLNSARIFEDFLVKHREGKRLEHADRSDLEHFTAWGRKELKSVYRCLMGIRAFYMSLDRVDLANTATELMEFSLNETRKLGEFLKVDRECVEKLDAMGIKTVNQFLEIDQSPESLRQLAKKCGSPVESIVELAKLSNLSRLPGLKKVRGRLFYEGGLDSIEKIAARDTDQVCETLTEFIRQSGYDGSPPTRSEAQFTVEMARFMLRR